MKILLAVCLVALTAGCQQLQQLPMPKGTIGVTVTYTLADEDKPVAEVKSDPKPD